MLGQGALNHEYPYSIEDAPDEDAPDEDGVMRTVYVFHTIPAGEPLRRVNDYSAAPMSPRPGAIAEKVPLERHQVAHFESTRSGPLTAEKREQALVDQFTAELDSRGHVLSR